MLKKLSMQNNEAEMMKDATSVTQKCGETEVEKVKYPFFTRTKTYLVQQKIEVLLRIEVDLIRLLLSSSTNFP